MKRVDIDIPRQDRDVLIVPDARELPQLVRENARAIGAYRVSLAGRPLVELREAARREIMSAATEYTASLGVPAPAWRGEPIVETGHQPEFYHPGVWAKNHLCAKLAEAVGGIGLNLVVDNDVPREEELTFPVHAHGAFTQHGVHFAPTDRTRAWEEHTDKALWQFDHLAGEVKDLLPIADETLIIEPFMTDVTHCMSEARDTGHLMTLLRRRYEETIGLRNLEIPTSVMCETRAWALFVLSLVQKAERFAKIYNDAVHEYRRVNGVRSSSHPVPDLGVEENRVELPFWVWTPGGERQRLWITTKRDRTLLMDETPLFTIDAATWPTLTSGDRKTFDKTARRLLAEGKGHFRIRPRALSNTIFARMLLADVFIHGVGGAKYDTITDEIIRGFFGVEPPRLIACSATVFLPIDVEASRQDDLRRLRWELRDVFYNADRHMSEELRRSDRAEELVTEKRRLVTRNRRLRSRVRELGRTRTRAERRGIFTDIRTHNAEMLQLIEDRVAALREELERVEHHVGDAAVVRQRGYPFVLYPEQQLLDFYAESIRFG